jgi:hypothetical protein
MALREGWMRERERDLVVDGCGCGFDVRLVVHQADLA